MALLRNIISNGLADVVQMLIPLATLPIIYRMVGAEQYGLISFFSLLQVLIQLLDTGFGHTVTREIGRFNDSEAPGESDKQANLVYTLQFVYGGIGLIATTAIWVAAPAIVQYWITAHTIPASDLIDTIRLVAVVIGLSRLGFLYGAVLIATERSYLNSAIGTGSSIISALCTVLIVIFVSPTARAVVLANIVIVIANILVLYAMNRRHVFAGRSLSFDLSLLTMKLSFTVQNVIAVALGTLMQFLDKVYVSSHFTLDVLGNYNIVASLALVISRPLGPITTAIYPRMVSYFANNKPAKFRDLFETSWQGMNSLMIVCIYGVIFFGNDIITVLTGRPEIGERYHLILVLLAFAAALNGASRSLFLVQLCYGDSKTALWVNVISFILYFPAVFVTIRWLGIAAPAANSVLISLAGLIALAVRTNRLFGGGHMLGWIKTSFALQTVTAGVPMLLVWWLLPAGLIAWERVVCGVIAGTLALVSAILVSCNLRQHVARLLRNLTFKLRRSYS